MYGRMDNMAVPGSSRASCHPLSSSEITASTLLPLEKALSLQAQVMVADGHCTGSL